MAVKPPERVATALSTGGWAREGFSNERQVEVAVQAGDLIVIRAMGESSQSTSELTPTFNVTGGGLTWTQRVVKPASGNSLTTMHTVYTAIATESTTLAINVNWTNSASVNTNWGVRANVWRGSSGVGKAAINSNGVGSNSPATMEIETEGDNSGLDCGDSDWQAATGTPITWATINGAAGTKVDSYQGGSDYSALTAYYTDAGTKGTKTVTVSENGESQRYHISAVEVLGKEETPETPQELVPDADTEVTGWS